LRILAIASRFAADLASDLLDEEAAQTEGEEVIIRMIKRKREQLLFAIERVRDMPLDLDKM
jgi:hypothetical protein